MMRHTLLFLFLLLWTGAVGAQQCADYSRMSPMVRRLAVQQSHVSTRALAGQQSSLCALVRMSGDARHELQSEGCRLIASLGDIHVVDIPLNRLSALSRHAHVSRIEAERSCRLCNDTSAVITRSADVRQGTGLPFSLTGKGVVMGVVDVGIDLTHPNFFTADGKHYRIASFWDQLATDPEEAVGGTPCYVGTLFSDSASILSHARSVDSPLLFHGTHTLGTCGGSGASTPYVGMAPESELCVVSNAVSTDIPLIPDTLLARYTTATDILAFKQIFDYAEEQGKPCVVSFSEGFSQTFESECTLYDEALAQLTGPGRILVASAGNEGHIPTYLYKDSSTPSVATFLDMNGGTSASFSVRTDGHPVLRTVVWRSAVSRDTLDVSADWLCQQPDSFFCDTLTIDGSRYALAVAALPNAYEDGKTAYEYVLKKPQASDDYPKFQFELLESEAEAELFAVSGRFVADALNPQAMRGEQSHKVYYPGCSPAVVCVGATVWRTGHPRPDGTWHVNGYWGGGGQLGGFSSVGPTLDRRVKPDVVAPGANILSSSNSYYDEANPGDTEFVVCRQSHAGRTYSWRSELGTSMSTPIVAGIVAQWLEANPNLSPDDVKQVLARTSRRLDTLQTVPNSQWGYGEIDAYAGLIEVLGMTRIDYADRQAPSSVSIVPIGAGRVRISFSGPSVPRHFTVRIYRPGGQLVKERACAAQDANACELEVGESGIYLVQVITDNPSLTGSRIVRL